MSAMLKSGLLASLLLLTTAEEASNSRCRLWMAPSTTSSQSAPKLGLFAGINYQENETVGYPEIGIPLLDFLTDWNRRQSQLDSMIVDFLEGYMWTGEYAGSKYESSHSSVLAIPGLGTMANYHSGTHNVDWVQGAVLLRERSSATQPGVAHPSRGAISPFYNLTMRATQPIGMGMEIFANFGEVWDGNSTEDIYGDQLTRLDYVEADRVLDKILDFLRKYDREMTPQLKEEVMDFLFGKVLGAAAGSRAKVIRSLLPTHPGKLQTVKDMGGTFQYRNTDLVKSPKWLRKHGVCMDNLRGGPSTIPDAGRGAFATRFMAKDTIIAPAPMLQIPDKDLMDVYKLETRENNEYGKFVVPNRANGPTGKQLMINYCYGHRESSLLLLPIGGMVNLINHKPNGKGANAKIRWSNNKHWGNRASLVDVPPPKLVEDPNLQHVHIVMEVVATRDILPGEEVFIDYGPSWAKAWDKYMAEWNAVHQNDRSWPIRAEDLREEYKTKPYKTMEENEVSPYPPGIFTACFVEADEVVEDGEMKKTEEGLDILRWVKPVSFEEISGLHMRPCEIVGRSEELDDGFFFNYTARVHDSDSVTVVKDIPHFAFTFLDMPYTSDIYTDGAFRHYIGLPDAIFPQSWRDRRG